MAAPTPSLEELLSNGVVAARVLDGLDTGSALRLLSCCKALSTLRLTHEHALALALRRCKAPLDARAVARCASRALRLALSTPRLTTLDFDGCLARISDTTACELVRSSAETLVRLDFACACPPHKRVRVRSDAAENEETFTPEGVVKSAHGRKGAHIPSLTLWSQSFQVARQL